MAVIVSSGFRLGREESASTLPNERPVGRRPARCGAHAHFHSDCNGCRRATIFAIQAREAELREFRGLMRAPERVR